MEQNETTWVKLYMLNTSKFAKFIGERDDIAKLSQVRIKCGLDRGVEASIKII